MERIDFEPNYFIEGSQTPEEESLYWKALRGEVVSLQALRKDPIYRLLHGCPEDESNEEILHAESR